MWLLIILVLFYVRHCEVSFNDPICLFIYIGKYDTLLNQKNDER